MNITSATFTLLLSTVSSIALATGDYSCPEGTKQIGEPPPKSNQVKCVNQQDEQDGPYWQWYGNGQLMQAMNFKNGLEHGKQKAWFPNGNLMMEGVSVEGKRYQGFKYFNYHGEPVEIKIKTLEEMLPAK